MEKDRKSKKILLINPEGWGRGINIGLGYIAAMLSLKGHEVKVIDLNNYQKRKDERLKDAIKWSPDYTGVSISTSFQIREAMATLDKCRKIWHQEIGPGQTCVYLAGGIGAGLAGPELFDKYQGLFDILVKGEGEYVLLDIVEGKDLSGIDGIIYKKSGKVIENKDRGLIEGLDSLPFPRYEAFDYLPSFEAGSYDIITSRGCPYNCVFCLNKLLTKRRFRSRSPQNVVDEIARAKKIFGTKDFRIQDDNFTLDVARSEKICDLIIRHGLDIKFHLENGVRADKLTDGLAKKLSKAGCVSAIIGIENGDEKTFDLVKKGESLDEITRAIKILIENNITPKGTAIIGLMNTTFESDMNSVKFIKSLGIESIWHHAFPFKGTELYDWAKKNGRFLNPSFDSFDIQIPFETLGFNPVAFEVPQYTKKERNRAYVLACVRTGQYLRPLFGLKVWDIKRFFETICIIWAYDKGIMPHFLSTVFKTVARRPIRLVSKSFVLTLY